MKSYFNPDDRLRFKQPPTWFILSTASVGLCMWEMLPHLYRPESSSTRVIFGLMTNTVPLHSTSNNPNIAWVCTACVFYPMACFSSSLWTGTESFPKKRLMIGRLLANLSFTSISSTSVGRDTKLNLWRNKETQISQCHWIGMMFDICVCATVSSHLFASLLGSNSFQQQTRKTLNTK